MSEQQESFNPEYNPLGAEGSIDTNAMPWIPVKGVKGLFVKPIRVSPESGSMTLYTYFFNSTFKLLGGEDSNISWYEVFKDF